MPSCTRRSLLEAAASRTFRGALEFFPTRSRPRGVLEALGGARRGVVGFTLAAPRGLRPAGKRWQPSSREDYVPEMVMAETRSVGAAVLDFRTKSSPTASMLLSIVSRFEEIVTSPTGVVSSPDRKSTRLNSSHVKSS